MRDLFRPVWGESKKDSPGHCRRRKGKVKEIKSETFRYPLLRANVIILQMY